jgi:hypothetical protein
MGSSWVVQLLRSENVMFCTFHSSLPLVAVLSPVNPVYPSHPTTVRTILMLFYRPRLCFQNDSILTCFVIKTFYVFIYSFIRIKFPTDLVFLDLIIRVVFGVVSDAFNVVKTIKSVHIILKIKETNSVQSSEDLTFILTIYKTYVLSSLWTHFVSISKIAWSMLCREVVVICY